MDWTFDFGWVILGLIIFCAGGAMVLFYRQIADNMVNGVSSYDKVKFWGIITMVVGFIIMVNLHTLILTAFVNIIKPGK